MNYTFDNVLLSKQFSRIQTKYDYVQKIILYMCFQENLNNELDNCFIYTVIMSGTYILSCPVQTQVYMAGYALRFPYY